VLALLFMTALTGLVAGAGARRQTSRAGLALGGVLIGIADVAKHAPEVWREGPWRSGWLSMLLAAGLTVSAMATAITGYIAWREGRQARPGTPGRQA
jgi:hypothetical protein